jgi:predicted dienelactone hydrolase
MLGHHRRFGLGPLLLLSALLAASCSSDGGSDDPSDTSTSGDTDAQADVATDTGGDTAPGPQCVDGFCAAGPDEAPEPTALGPFPVGVRTFEWVDEDQVYNNMEPDTGEARTLKTEIWYPTNEAFRGEPGVELGLYDDAPPEAVAAFIETSGNDPDVREKMGAVAVDAVRDAPVRDDVGAFPLIVFSHGAYGVRFQSFFLTITLASHGYVVISTDHEHNVIYDLLMEGIDEGGVSHSARRRPLDTIFLMDRMAQKSADPDDDFYGVVDTENVGITGHSFGGLTAYLVADQDPRVKAIVPMAPATMMAELLGVDFDAFAVPQLVMEAMLDKTLSEDDIWAWNPWQRFQPPKWFARILTGGHYTFTDMCRLDLDYMVNTLGYIDAEDALIDGCGDFNWGWEEAHEAILQMNVSFFNHFLRHSPASAEHFAPAAMEKWSEHIEYFAEPGG